MPFHNPKLENGETLDTVALNLCAEVCDSLKDSMVGRTEFPPPPEAYTVFCLTDLAGVNDVNRWLGEQRRDVAGLLTETAASQLSEAQVGEVLRIQRSFENTDLAVIDWDARAGGGLDGLCGRCVLRVGTGEPATGGIPRDGPASGQISRPRL